MVLCVLFLNRLLVKLDTVPTGLRVGNSARKEVATTYADDVTVLLLDPRDVAAVQDILQLYEQATAAFNVRVSWSFPLGSRTSQQMH